MFVSEFNIRINIMNISTIMSKELFTKLFKILYLDTKFKGFFLWTPSLSFIFDLSHLIICQSPLVHLLSLVLKLKYDVGYPSISIMSDAKPHLK